MTSIPPGTTRQAAVTIAAAGLTSAMVYWQVFVRPFPLGGHYDTIPPVDYAKLTGHSARGAVSFVIAIAVLFGLYFFVMRTLQTASAGTSPPEKPATYRRRAWGIVMGGTALLGAILVPAYPIAAIDVLIYAIHTRGWALYGLNPLATAPQSLPGDPWIGLAAEWVNAPSPYGTVWEGVSLLAFKLVGGDFLAHMLALKAIAALSHLGCAFLVALILLRLKPDKALAGAAAFGWNPMALLESAGNGHNDILMVLFLLLAVYLCLDDRHRWLVVPVLTLSALTKFVTVMAFPFFLLYLARRQTTWPRRLTMTAANLALAAGLGAALMAPVWPGWDQWALRGLGGGAGKSPFAFLVLILRPWLGINVAFAVGRYLLGGIFLLICLRLVWRAITGPLTLTDVVIAPTFGVFYWYLVLPNQQFHAWYLLWPLAMAVLLWPSPLFDRIAVFGLTAWLSIPLYETLRVWWWDTLMPLVIYTIAIPFVFGLPLLVGWLRQERSANEQNSLSPTR